MLVHADNMPVIDRNFEAMLVWMDEEVMDLDKSFFIKHTTNTGRTRIDGIKYKVDVNTMEHLSVENGKLKNGGSAFAIESDCPCDIYYCQAAFL
mgnify:CR=1 FL=1